jgi:hypothetical protein
MTAADAPKDRDGAARLVLTVMTIWLLVTAVRQQRRLPPGERTWHGAVDVAVPYDLRPPTLQRLRQRLWAPEEPRLFVPQVFGVGWTVNLARLLRRHA